MQRGFREDKILGNRDVLDYLKEIGVDRVQCLIVYGKASEALFWSVGNQDLTFEQVESAVQFLRDTGVSDSDIPQARSLR